jgi:hypothetical protein
LAVAGVAAAFLFGKGALRLAAIGAMAASAAGASSPISARLKGAIAKPGQFGRKWALEMAIWGSLLAVAAALTFVVTGRSPLFVLRGLLSSLISFGGGDAYLSVAEGMFVQTGTISAGHFYGNLIPVSNLLPGSILCKVLAGTGYYVGWGVRHSLVDAGLLWLAGFLVAVAGSGMTFGTVRLIYDALERLDTFACLSRWIQAHRRRAAAQHLPVTHQPEPDHRRHPGHLRRRRRGHHRRDPRRQPGAALQPPGQIRRDDRLLGLSQRPHRRLPGLIIRMRNLHRLCV